MERTDDGDKASLQVSEHEGTVLGLIARRQPLSRYQVLKAFERSPAKINESKGSVYPLVKRMLDRGFVSEGRSSGKRGTSLLSLTGEGYDALRQWVLTLRSQHILFHDPLANRVLLLGQLTRDQRVRWIATAKRLVLAKRDEIEAYHQMVAIPYQRFLESYFLANLDAKLRFLDELLIEIVEEPQAQRRSSVAWDPPTRETPAARNAPQKASKSKEEER